MEAVKELLKQSKTIFEQTYVKLSSNLELTLLQRVKYKFKKKESDIEP